MAGEKRSPQAERGYRKILRKIQRSSGGPAPLRSERRAENQLPRRPASQGQRPEIPSPWGAAPAAPAQALVADLAYLLGGGFSDQHRQLALHFFSTGVPDVLVLLEVDTLFDHFVKKVLGLGPPWDALIKKRLLELNARRRTLSSPPTP